MAGDWIKMRTRLGEERSVMVICDLTGLDQFAVVGRLHAIWAWAGDHTVTGEVSDVTLRTIDRVTCCEGFAKAMTAARWLEETENGGVRFPRWKKHNSKAAKQRALAAERQAKKRAKKSRPHRDCLRDNSVTSHAPTEESESESEQSQRRTDLTGQSDQGAEPDSEQSDQIFISSLELEGCARWLFDAIGYRGPDGQFLWQAAALRNAGKISEAELADSVRGVQLKKPRNPIGYLRRCLNEIVRKRGPGLTDLMKIVRVPNCPKTAPAVNRSSTNSPILNGIPRDPTTEQLKEKARQQFEKLGAKA